MDARQQILNHFADALPKTFDFYHLGKVELQAQSFDIDPESTAVAFRIQGDVAVWAIVFFARELDASTYTELGNVLASKIATYLNSQIGTEVMVSSPHMLNSPQLERILTHASPLIRRTYMHFRKESIVPIEAWIISATGEEIGYV